MVLDVVADGRVERRLELLGEQKRRAQGERELERALEERVALGKIRCAPARFASKLEQLLCLAELRGISGSSSEATGRFYAVVELSEQKKNHLLALDTLDGDRSVPWTLLSPLLLDSAIVLRPRCPSIGRSCSESHAWCACVEATGRSSISRTVLCFEEAAVGGLLDSPGRRKKR